MKKGIKIILFCLLLIVAGCQKEELDLLKEEGIVEETELSGLKLLEPNNSIVSDIIGNKTKSGIDENNVEVEYPWLLDLESDDKDRLVFCMKTANSFTDRKMVYVKDGEHRFNYIVERTYVYSEATSIDDISAIQRASFSGVYTIYTAENKPLYSYFYSNNKLVGETNILEYINNNQGSSLKIQDSQDEEIIIDGGELGEANAIGTRSSGGGDTYNKMWFLQNTGRNLGFPDAGSNDDGHDYIYVYHAGSTTPTVEKLYDIDKYPRDERADIELTYLSLHGQAKLAEILAEILSKSSNFTAEDRIAIYVSIHNAYLRLQGKYLIALTEAYVESFKPLIEIALFEIGGEAVFKLLSCLPKLATAGSELVWKSISNSSECYVSSKIPKTFVFTANNGRKFYIPESGTKHLDQILKKNGALYEPWFVNSIEIRSQLILEDCVNAANRIIEEEGAILIYQTKYYKNGWEFMFNSSNSGGYPVIYHIVKLSTTL